MFYQDRLIVGYIQEPESNRYIFQLAGGDEIETTKEDFFKNWQAYRQFENERLAQYLEHYRPLPVTLEIRRSLKVYPVSRALKRRRQPA